ncbi:hypothetical protein Tco_1325373 [Tanacetum coccineum]
MLDPEVRIAALPTVPFVTSSVSATPEHEGGDQTDSVTGANLQTINAPQRFVISSDYYHHSGANVAEAKVDSVVTEFMVGGIRTVVEPDFDLQKVYVLQWSINNESCVYDGRVCRRMLDEFYPLKFFASIRGIKHDQLFTEFNVGAARQISLSTEVRMRAEYNIKEKRRPRSIVDEQMELLKVRDGEMVNISLKAQLVVEDGEADEGYSSWNGDLVDQVHWLEIPLSVLQVKVNACLNSSAYLSILGAATSKAIKKGMQDGLAVVITHGQEGRVLTDVAAFNPSAESDYISALQELQSLNFSLFPDLQSNKDASLETLMNILHLDDTLMERLDLDASHPHVDQLMENIVNNRLALHDVFVSFFEPLSIVALEGTKGNFGAAPDTTNALSTTYASASSIPLIFIDDYVVVHADNQDSTGVDGQAGVGTNVNPFPNIDDAELDIS